jgi:hypothetical protein
VMAGDVLETDSMQQTEDETRKADGASRMRMMDGGCHLDSAASRDAVHERDACRNSPAPARTTTPRSTAEPAQAQAQAQGCSRRSSFAMAARVGRHGRGEAGSQWTAMCMGKRCRYPAVCMRSGHDDGGERASSAR